MLNDAKLLALSGRLRNLADSMGEGVLYPVWFVDDLKATVEEIIAAFRILEHQDYVEGRLSVRCENGHLWDGRPEEFGSLKACPVCDEPFGPDVFMELRFVKKKRLTRSSRPAVQVA